MGTEEGLELRADQLIAKLSENYISKEVGCLNILKSYRCLNSILNESSATKTSLPSLNAN